MRSTDQLDIFPDERIDIPERLLRGARAHTGFTGRLSSAGVLDEERLIAGFHVERERAKRMVPARRVSVVRVVLRNDQAT
jgi:hypothetical protein